jgi:class 3 adenylate cyclase
MRPGRCAMVQERKVVQLPILRGSSVADALSGFAPQIEQNEHLGRRVERAVTAIAVEIRGWPEVAEWIGTDGAQRLCLQLVGEITRAVESANGSHVSVGGRQASPVLTATFSGDLHATRALFAAQHARDIAARPLHPSMREQFHASIGVNSGTVTHTHVNGSRLEFRSMGTVRMFATRLQEFAGPDQIFVAASTLRAVPVGLDVVPIGPVRTNGDGEQQEAYCLMGFVAREGAL